MQTGLELPFADGTYRFKLSVAGILELQRLTRSGFGELGARIMTGRYQGDSEGAFGFPLEARYKIEDLLETIRLALIGGGTDPLRAKELIGAYCYPEQPLKDAWNLAAAIIGTALEGMLEATEEMPDQHPVKKKSGPKRTRKGISTPEKSIQT